MGCGASSAKTFPAEASDDEASTAVGLHSEKPSKATPATAADQKISGVGTVLVDPSSEIAKTAKVVKSDGSPPELVRLPFVQSTSVSPELSTAGHDPQSAPAFPGKPALSPIATTQPLALASPARPSNPTYSRANRSSPTNSTDGLTEEQRERLIRRTQSRNRREREALACAENMERVADLAHGTAPSVEEVVGWVKGAQFVSKTTRADPSTPKLSTWKPLTARVVVNSSPALEVAEREAVEAIVMPAVSKAFEDYRKKPAHVDYWMEPSQASTPDLLERIFSEIDRARPLFITIVSNPCGPPLDPSDVPIAVLAVHPWLAECTGMALEEVALVYAMRGADGTDTGDAPLVLPIVYMLRDACAGSVEVVREAEAGTGDESMRDRLEQAERNGKIQLHEFASTIELVDGLTRDLSAALATVAQSIAGDQALGLFDDDDHLHAAFAHARRTAHYSREEEVAALDQFLLGRERVMLLASPPGRGKAALLATWIARVENDQSQGPVIWHFTSSSPSAADPVRMVTRLTRALRRVVPGVQTLDGAPLLDGPGGADPAGAFRRFRELLAAASEALGRVQSRVMIIVEGVDAFSDVTGGNDLAWLPWTPPARIKILLSCSDESPVVLTCRRRQWREMKVDPLSEIGRRGIIELVAGEGAAVGRDFTPIVEAEQSADPLFVCLATSEMMRVVDREDVERAAHLKSLLEGGIPSLMSEILQRVHRECDSSSPADPSAASDTDALSCCPVTDVLCAVWTSRFGPTVKDLAMLLALPRRTLAGLLATLSPLLITTSGHVVFSHQCVRIAVETRYLVTRRQKCAAFERVAPAWVEAAADPAAAGRRVVAEAAFALAGTVGGQAGEERLRAFIGRPDVFRVLVGGDQAVWMDELKSLWEAAGGMDLAGKIYLQISEVIFDHPDPDPFMYTVEDIRIFATFLSAHGQHVPARAILSYLIARASPPDPRDALSLSRTCKALGLLGAREYNLMRVGRSGGQGPVFDEVDVELAECLVQRGRATEGRAVCVNVLRRVMAEGGEVEVERAGLVVGLCYAIADIDARRGELRSAMALILAATQVAEKVVGPVHLQLVPEYAFARNVLERTRSLLQSLSGATDEDGNIDPSAYPDCLLAHLPNSPGSGWYPSGTRIEWDYDDLSVLIDASLPASPSPVSPTVPHRGSIRTSTLIAVRSPGRRSSSAFSFGIDLAGEASDGDTEIDAYGRQWQLVACFDVEERVERQLKGRATPGEYVWTVAVVGGLDLDGAYVGDEDGLETGALFDSVAFVVAGEENEAFGPDRNLGEPFQVSRSGVAGHVVELHVDFRTRPWVVGVNGAGTLTHRFTLPGEDTGGTGNVGVEMTSTMYRVWRHKDMMKILHG
ncbi:hypothetical protein BDK51DRAFT_42593 [Blyttiomyces helicus]|uniref:Uncharacterized protein n=1 Tax=Blyttiomyces helicus TaxID=388810 RepID=A0A4P9WKU8_9FUNG|nr:hypothetical protein BDK51DRAFT_42593 [Blyttiomyces helicus]|eukprot:RKO93631.1 hypothetical protein BDK51DRAFT_42593 [Blyttiomyces helicus]